MEQIPKKKKIQVSIQIGEDFFTYLVNPKMLTSQLCDKFYQNNPSKIVKEKELQFYLEDKILPHPFTLEYNLVYDKCVLKGVWIDVDDDKLSPKRDDNMLLSMKAEEKRKIKTNAKSIISFILLYNDKQIQFDYECKPITNISTMVKDICLFLKMEIEMKKKIHLVWNHDCCLSKNAQIKDYPFQNYDILQLIFSFPIYIHSDKYPETVVYVHEFHHIHDIVKMYQLFNQIDCKDILFSKDDNPLINDKKINDYDIHPYDILKVCQIKIDFFSLFKKDVKKKSSFFASSVMFNAPEPHSLPLPPPDFL